MIHNKDTLEVLLTSTLNEGAGNESWGIKDFFVSVGKF